MKDQEIMQSQLFYESIYEAMTDLVRALGGPKKVGPMLWPDKSIDAAAQLLRDSINSHRKERLNQEQTMFLLRKAREIGWHAAINFICEQVGYSAPTPIEPQDQVAALQRAYVESVRQQKQITERMERLMSGPQIRAI